MGSPYGYGSLPTSPDTWFEMLEPSEEYADFSYDATTLLSPGDSIVGLSMAAMPSGTGEVNLSRLQLGPDAEGNLTLVTVWITGGVPGRLYYYQLTVYTALTRILTIIIGQVANPLLASCPVPPPVNPGFGAAITWGTT